MCHIPIIKPARDILEKYALTAQATGKLLPVLSNQKMNAYLKEIAAIVGIDKDLTTHCSSHNKIFCYLNINELSTLKNVTANGLETSYILFLSQLCNIKRTLLKNKDKSKI